MKGLAHLLVIVAAFYAGTLAAAPRSAPVIPVNGIPVSLESNPEQIGAPSPGTMPSRPPAAGHSASLPVRAPTTRRSVGPTVPVSPRPTARPTQRKTRDDASSSTAPRISPSIPPRRVASATPARTGVAGAQKLTGYASWYGTGGPGLYAALPGYVDGSRVQVAVCAFPDGHATCVTVPVVTQCGCPGSAVVDLSPPAFRALGVPLSVGLVKVTVEVLR